LLLCNDDQAADDLVLVYQYFVRENLRLVAGKKVTDNISQGKFTRFLKNLTVAEWSLFQLFVRVVEHVKDYLVK